MQPNVQNTTFLNIAQNWEANPRIPVVSVGQLRDLITPLSAREPGFIELDSASGLLQLGLGGEFACAHFTTREHKPRYLAAQAKIVRATKDVEFLCGGTPTPIAPQLCLTFEDAVRIAEHFFRTQHRDPHFEWIEI